MGNRGTLQINGETKRVTPLSMKPFFKAITVTAIGALLLVTSQVKPTLKPTISNVIEKPVAVAQTKAPVENPPQTTSPQPIEALKPTQYPAGCEQYRAIVAQYDWDVRVAMAVMQAESGCNPMDVNWGDHHDWAGCSGSFGLFQINCSHGQLYEPNENIRVAHIMYEASGWKPWTAHSSGAYLKYL